MLLFEEEGNFKEGAMLLVDKPFKWTSFDVVNKIRWGLRSKYGKLKVGHAGTLDPLATGLVIICTGKWTKRIEAYMQEMKEYVAQIEFGMVTPSFDLETEKIGNYPYEHIDRDRLDKVLEQFVGKIKQVPPVYSAIRVDGKRAYEKARKGKGDELELQSREIYIKEIEVLKFELPYLELRIVCSKGTYIRSLADDIGKACGSGAHLSGLRRTMIGKYKIEDAINLEELVALIQQNV